MYWSVDSDAQLEAPAALMEWLSIPSVSADPARSDDVAGAARWIARHMDGTPGAEIEVRQLPAGRLPAVVGRVAASARIDTAPTIALYGHFDVQPAGDLAEWTSAPFDPAVREGWIYGRGAADSKANSFIVLEAVKRLAATGSLPVNVELLFDGEEEIDGLGIPDLAAARTPPDAAVICDGSLWDESTPCFWISVRGTLYYRLSIRTAERELHSGNYGGAALNAADAMVRCLGGATSAPIGNRKMGGDDSPIEVAAGAEMLRRAGARPADLAANAEFYSRTTLWSAVDVNSISTGDLRLRKTSIPDVAVADVSVRVGPGDDHRELDADFRARLEASAPSGADLEIEALGAIAAGRTAPDSLPARLAAAAFGRAFGTTPLLLGNGGTLPLFSTYAELGVPTILTGFASPDGAAHAADERFPIANLQRGIDAAAELLTSFGALAGR